MQEKDRCIAAIKVVTPIAVVAPFAVTAIIAGNAAIFMSGSCYQLWSGSPCSLQWRLNLDEVVLPSPQASEQSLLNHIESNQTGIKFQ